MDKHSEKIVTVGEVIGKKVIDSKDNDLGKIDEIVFNKLTGETRYVVLSCGGILGFSNTLYAIPWSSFNYVPEKDKFLLKVDKEKLRSAPGFNKEYWPNFADTTFIKSISDFYN